MFVLNPVFDVGRLVATRGVNELMQENPEFDQFVQKCLQRHVKGAMRTMRTNRPMTPA